MYIEARNATAAIAGVAAIAGAPAPLAPSGGEMSASFTTYGGCARATLQCGWYTRSGTYTAAISQVAFGQGPGDPGPACNRCYQISAPGRTTIVVKVADLCPADSGNPRCHAGMPGNPIDIHVDLCEDSGASAAFFGTSGGGLKDPLVEKGGKAKVVDCGLLAGKGQEIGNAETIGKGFPTDISKNCQKPWC